MRDEERRKGRLPETPSVLITAHGVSDRERHGWNRGQTVLDTTCPLVRRVHQAASRLQAEGYHVLVIGQRGHVEVEGITERPRAVRCDRVGQEVEDLSFPRLGIVCQTTATERKVDAIRATVARLNPDAQIKFVDTVCLPTKEHQRALERLLDRVEAVVVVGGSRSNNTRELVMRCRERKNPCCTCRPPVSSTRPGSSHLRRSA